MLAMLAEFAVRTMLKLLWILLAAVSALDAGAGTGVSSGGRGDPEHHATPTAYIAIATSLVGLGAIGSLAVAVLWYRAGCRSYARTRDLPPIDNRL